MELLKIKLGKLGDDYIDEINYFIDMLENLIMHDYDVEKSMDTIRKAAKYYVSPRFFDRLVQLS